MKLRLRLWVICALVSAFVTVVASQAATSSADTPPKRSAVAALPKPEAAPEPETASGQWAVLALGLLAIGLRWRPHDDDDWR
jgi:hypothetical protein